MSAIGIQCPACGHHNRGDAAFCADCGTGLATQVRCPSCGRANALGQRFCDGCGTPLEPISDSPDLRQTMVDGPLAFVDGRYRTERLLGEGAYKKVFLAHDARLGRNVAFALIKASDIGEQLAERIRREARTMGRLVAHPNVVTVYDAGEDAGRPYIIEEYVEGGTVAELLAKSDGAPLELDQALRIGAGLCSALEHVHEHGIVHRDLKPDNVWLTADGTPKLGDFGLQAALREVRSSTLAKLTSEGTILGTAAYVPPEQALGHPVGPRADLYSLGATLYELTTGAPPFAGDDQLAIISQHVRTPPVAPAWHNESIPAVLNELILRLLEKDPRKRPASATDVRAVIDALGTAPGEHLPAHARQANPLEGLAGGVYVGREGEIDELCAAVDVAVRGRGQLVLIAGEGGIGKTRLAEQVTTYAQLRGATVLWGRCYEGDGAPPYWPWAQVIRAYTADHDRELLASVMGIGAADIAQMVSEIRTRLPDLPEPPTLGAEQARFRLFDSVTRFLINASCQEPLVVVLDDLHHADPSSLMLLEFLAAQLGESQLLVVGTYRDSELRADHALAHTLGQLARGAPLRRVMLQGLARRHVARYIQMTAGIEPPDDLVDLVTGKSEGNPFFVAEIVRLLSATGRLETAGRDMERLAIPDEVRDLVGRRLAGVSEDCRNALTVGAVIGRDFHINVVGEVVSLPAERLLEAIDEAIAARVITETSPGRYRFSHVLIADTLADSLPTSRRVRLHFEVACAGESAYAHDLVPYLHMLAHHFLEAAPAGGLEKGLHYAVAAAENAEARLAHDEAARLYARALRHADPSAVSGDRRCDLLLALGEAHAHAGATDEARAVFGQAAELARAIGSTSLLARSALGFGGPRPSFGVVDHELVRLLEESLSRLQADDEELRSRLQARLAMELYFAGEEGRRDDLVEDAAATARRLEDPATLAYALNARHQVMSGPAKTEERLAIAGEVVDLARAAGDRELELEGHHRRAVTALEIGDATTATAEIAAHARLAEELRQPYGRWQAAAWRATEALLAGGVAEGTTLAQEAYSLGEQVRATDAAHCFAIQALVGAIGRDGMAELMENFEQLAEEFPATRWSEAGLPFVNAELGRRDEALEAFEPVAAAGFHVLPRDNQWLVSITAIADCCAYLGDAPRAREIYELMEPYGGRTVMMPEGWACFGSADRALGLLAATMEEWDTAELHFEVALGLDNTMGARAWQARTEYGYGCMLLARGGAGERARSLLEQARANALELGLTRLVARVDEALAVS